jgi:hypothetical protein
LKKTIDISIYNDTELIYKLSYNIKPRNKPNSIQVKDTNKKRLFFSKNIKSFIGDSYQFDIRKNEKSYSLYHDGVLLTTLNIEKISNIMSNNKMCLTIKN